MNNKAKHEVLIELMLKKNDLSIATYKRPMTTEESQAYNFAFNMLDDLIKKFKVGEDGIN